MAASVELTKTRFVIDGGVRESNVDLAPKGVVNVSASSDTIPAVPMRISPGAVAALKDRRRRRRVAVQPMYTTAVVRRGGREGPLDGHVLNVSETGLSVELDDLIPVGQRVELEFSVAGLGMFRNEAWPTYCVTAEVVRIDDLEDFPKGPYKMALRFDRVASMVQAQIARFIMNVAK